MGTIISPNKILLNWEFHPGIHVLVILVPLLGGSGGLSKWVNNGDN